MRREVGWARFRVRIGLERLRRGFSGRGGRRRQGERRSRRSWLRWMEVVWASVEVRMDLGWTSVMIRVGNRLALCHVLLQNMSY